MFDEKDDKAEAALGEAIESSSGYSVAGMTLYLACRSYAKRGTLEEFERITRRVIAEFWNDDVEATVAVPAKGQQNSASASSPKAAGGAISQMPDKGQLTIASPGRHSRTKRGLESIKAVEPTIKKGLLEMLKTHDGIIWGSVGWHELDGRYRDGTIAKLIKERANPPKDRYAELRTVVTNRQFEEIIDAANKQSAA